MHNQKNPNYLKRSWLYLPTVLDKLRTLEKDTGADVHVLDLEDGITAPVKDDGRSRLESLVRNEIIASKPVFIRVNGTSTPYFENDMKEVIRLKEYITGIVLPKVDCADDISRAATYLQGTHLEIMPIIETLKGEENRNQILDAGKERIRSVQTGHTGDYNAAFTDSTDIFDPRTDVVARDYLVNVMKSAKTRGMTVIAGAHRYIPGKENVQEHPVTDDLQNMANYLRHQLKMDGMLVVHPGQISTVNTCYLPTRQEYEFHENRIAQYNSSIRQGATMAVRYTLHGRDTFMAPPEKLQSERFLEQWEKYKSVIFDADAHERSQ